MVVLSAILSSRIAYETLEKAFIVFFFFLEFVLIHFAFHFPPFINGGFQHTSVCIGVLYFTFVDTTLFLILLVSTCKFRIEVIVLVYDVGTGFFVIVDFVKSCQIHLGLFMLQYRVFHFDERLRLRVVCVFELPEDGLELMHHRLLPGLRVEVFQGDFSILGERFQPALETFRVGHRAMLGFLLLTLSGLLEFGTVVDTVLYNI
mmetsp:Transcript_34214/g.74589  ORF Transcript_34214/g.74589 Transcript_34214/m.74589 type:complete len:204 (-) Transcript_34214:759-1370(-)